MKKYSSRIIVLLLLIMVIPLSDSAIMVHADESDYYNRIRKGLTYFRKVYERIQANYVEEIDPYEFAKAGIDGMLESLDPYTVFIEQEGETRLRIITTGKYGGLGMEIGMRNNHVTVISPMDNSPAQRAGIRAGDIIEKINDEAVSSLPPEEISKRLRGPVGTAVEISIRRPGFETPFIVKMVREEIIIEDVSYADFIAPGVAYVRLTSFTEKAGDELYKEIVELRKRGKIDSFILDLRGNSGGLLESAVEIASMFLPNGTTVVYTRGLRDGEHSFKTENEPLLPDVPLAVLVNNGSASASEIVAGALQDLDRAIIIGTNTFGKGLVQKVYNIDKDSNTKIKVTTAKYYIPSGRCVQKEDYTNKNSLFHKADIDSIAATESPREYFTSNNRRVLENGGIIPDRLVDEDSISFLVTELWRNSLPFNFAVQYKLDHPTWQGSFEINDIIYTQFMEYVSSSGFEYQTEGEAELHKFIELAKRSGLSSDIVAEAEDLYQKLQVEKASDLQNHREEISRVLIKELAEKYYGSREKFRYTVSFDKALQEAISVLENVQEYRDILAIK